MKSADKNRGVQIMLGVVAGLLALNLASSWFESSPRIAQAAGLPDSGAQLERLIDETSKLNKTSEKILALLDSGKLKVQVEKPAEK
jgi:hypothetical protein